MTANDLPTPDSAAVPVHPTTPAVAAPPSTPAEAAAAEPATVPAVAAAPSEAPPAGTAATMSPAACAEKLKSLFPALFTGPAKPIKLRIQADIQARAPGVFTKAALSGFLRRYTGGTGYLIALTRAPHRFDLDGQPAGEISAEHRQAAADELARRRQVHEGRRQAEEDQRRERAQLVRTFETTTLTKDNFCALKGITPEALDALLVQARQEAEEFARQRPPHAQPGGRPDHRGPRPDRRPPGPGQERSGPRGEHRGDQRRAGGGGPGGAPRGDARRDGAPRGDRGPRPPRPNR